MLTLGCVNDLLAGEPAMLLCLHRNKGYGSMTTVSLGLSTAYHLCLKPCAGLVDAALVDRHGFWVVCF